jgi:hypothetical protein
MVNGLEDKRIRKVAPMVWEVIGTFEKTVRGPRCLGQQRRYQICHPLAPVPASWPELDDARLSVVWHGWLCDFTPRQTNQYVLLRLLVKAQGRWVDYATIGTECLRNECAKADAIRQHKRRLVKILEAAGMGDLAEAIDVKGERMRLKL